MTAALIYSRRNKPHRTHAALSHSFQAAPSLHGYGVRFPTLLRSSRIVLAAPRSPFVNAACLAAPLSRGRYSYPVCSRFLHSHNTAPALQVRFIAVFSVLEKKDIYDPLTSNAAWTLRCEIAAFVCWSLSESVVVLYGDPG